MVVAVVGPGVGPGAGPGAGLVAGPGAGLAVEVFGDSLPHPNNEKATTAVATSGPKPFANRTMLASIIPGNVLGPKWLWTCASVCASVLQI